MIREAKPQDADYLVELAKKLGGIHYPELRLDAKQIKDLVGKAITSPQCKTLISYNEEGPQGGLVSLAHNGVWFERKVSSLAMVFTPVRGDGLKMLRIWKRFATSRPAFKVVDVGFPVRGDLARILQGIGMRSDGYHFIG